MTSTTCTAAPAGFLGLGGSAVPPYAGTGVVCPTPAPVQGTGLRAGRAGEAVRGATGAAVRLRGVARRPVIAWAGTDQIQPDPKSFLMEAFTSNRTSHDSTTLGSLASRRPPS